MSFDLVKYRLRVQANCKNRYVKLVLQISKHTAKGLQEHAAVSGLAAPRGSVSFRSIPSVTLRCYRDSEPESNIVRLTAIMLGMVSMSINVAIIFGETSQVRESTPLCPSHTSC
jgi:hypothetical protein